MGFELFFGMSDYWCDLVPFNCNTCHILNYTSRVWNEIASWTFQLLGTVQWFSPRKSPPTLLEMVSLLLSKICYTYCLYISYVGAAVNQAPTEIIALNGVQSSSKPQHYASIKVVFPAMGLSVNPRCLLWVLFYLFFLTVVPVSPA